MTDTQFPPLRHTNGKKFQCEHVEQITNGISVHKGKHSHVLNNSVQEITLTCIFQIARYARKDRHFCSSIRALSQANSLSLPKDSFFPFSSPSFSSVVPVPSCSGPLYLGASSGSH